LKKQMNILLCYRVQRFDAEIVNKLLKFNNDKIYMIVQDEFEKNFIIALVKLTTSLNNVKLDLNIITAENFLKGELDNMLKKFDYIVGNPPYQGSGDDSSEKIFNQISAKAISLLSKDGVISFITPTAILSPGQKNKKLNLQKIFAEKLVEIDFSVNNEFDIGQTICQWKLINKPNHDGIKLIFSDKTSEKVNNIFECVDLDNKVAQIITNKITWDFNINAKHEKMPIGQSNQARAARNISNIQSSEFTEKVYCNTKEQRIKYCKPSDTRKIKYNRLIIEYSGDWHIPPFIDNCETNALMFVNTKPLSDNKLLNLKSILVSKLFSFAIVYDKINGLKSSGLYNLLFKLTSPGLHKSWSDEELYKEFNITDNEKKVIEKWYKEWIK